MHRGREQGVYLGKRAKWKTQKKPFEKIEVSKRLRYMRNEKFKELGGVRCCFGNLTVGDFWKS